MSPCITARWLVHLFQVGIQSLLSLYILKIGILFHPCLQLIRTISKALPCNLLLNLATFPLLNRVAPPGRWYPQGGEICHTHLAVGGNIFHYSELFSNVDINIYEKKCCATLIIVSPNFCRAMNVFNGNSRILKWRYCTI